MGKEEQDKVRALLREAVTVLCRNGLTYTRELTVEGLLGITLDNQDVFLVSINECIKQGDNTAVSLGDNTAVELVKDVSTSPGGGTGNKVRKRLRDKCGTGTGNQAEEPNNKKSKDNGSSPGGTGDAREVVNDNEDGTTEKQDKQVKKTKNDEKEEDNSNSPVSHMAPVKLGTFMV